MKTKFLFLISILTLSISSCQDATDIRRDDIVTDEDRIFPDAASIDKGINGLYNSLPGEFEVRINSIFTDEVGLGKDNGGQGINDGTYNFFLNTGSDYADGLWNTYLNILNRTNRMLNRVEELRGEEGAAQVALDYREAELLAIRAYSHLKLFAYFTPDYTNPQGLSVIKFGFLQTDDFGNYVPRATVSEIVDLIKTDVQDAKDLRYNGSWIDSGTDSNTFVSRAFLNTILVKLYSMTGQYDLVEQYANEMITSSTFQLVNTKDAYKALFEDNGNNNTSEIIFRLKRITLQSNAVASIWYTNRVAPSGTGGASVQFEVGRSLYNLLDELDPSKTGSGYGSRSDIRYQVNVLPGSSPQPDYSDLSYDDYILNDLLYVGKYKGRNVQGGLMQNDILVFRYADILLSLAEVRAANGALTGSATLGDFSTVESIIYNLRYSRNEGVPSAMPIITDQASAWKAILDERRVEFAFEGYRYLDMKRIGVKAGAGFDRDAQDCVKNNACYLDASDYRLTMPIPRTEIQSNPAIRDQQNPGY